VVYSAGAGAVVLSVLVWTANQSYVVVYDPASMGDAQSSPGQDAIEMSTQQANQILEGF
jgi:hypothetical protein